MDVCNVLAQLLLYVSDLAPPPLFQQHQPLEQKMFL